MANSTNEGKNNICKKYIEAIKMNNVERKYIELKLHNKVHISEERESKELYLSRARAYVDARMHKNIHAQKLALDDLVWWFYWTN